MNLDALGNIGEFVGSIGVFVSLIYLAIQVRENTRSNYAAAVDRISTDIQAFILNIFQNEKANRVYAKYIFPRAGIEDVEDRDWIDVRLILTAAFMDLWRAYEKYERGQVEAEAWNVILTLFRSTYFQSPIVSHWLAETTIFPDSFMLFINKEIHDS